MVPPRRSSSLAIGIAVTSLDARSCATRPGPAKSSMRITFSTITSPRRRKFAARRSRFYEKRWLDVKRFGQLAEDRDAGRHSCSLDRANIPRTQSGQIRNIFLRQSTLMAKSTKIRRQNMLQIHPDGIR